MGPVAKGVTLRLGDPNDPSAAQQEIVSPSGKSTAAVSSRSEVDAEKGAEAREKPVPVVLRRILFGTGVAGEASREIPRQELVEAFQEIDEDCSGMIDADELVEALRLCGLEVSKGATDTLLKEIDQDMSGDIDVDEFIDFFRNLEELGQFQRRSQQRTKMMTWTMNLCFVGNLLLLCTLLLILFRLDDTGSDYYKMLQNGVIAVAAAVALLLVMVILVPFLRISLRKQQHHLREPALKYREARLKRQTKARTTAFAPNHRPSPAPAQLELRDSAAPGPGKDALARLPPSTEAPDFSWRTRRAPFGESVSHSQVSLASTAPQVLALTQTPVSHSPEELVRGEFVRYDPANYQLALTVMSGELGSPGGSWLERPLSRRAPSLGRSEVHDTRRLPAPWRPEAPQPPAGLPGAMPAIRDHYSQQPQHRGSTEAAICELADGAFLRATTMA